MQLDALQNIPYHTVKYFTATWFQYAATSGGPKDRQSYIGFYDKIR